MKKLEDISFYEYKEILEEENLQNGFNLIQLGTGLNCTDGEYIYKVFHLNEWYDKFATTDIQYKALKKLVDEKVFLQNICSYNNLSPKIEEVIYSSKLRMFIIRRKYYANYINLLDYVKTNVKSITDINILNEKLNLIFSKLVDLGISHGDFNTSNILINPENLDIKIIDFLYVHKFNLLNYASNIEDFLDTINELYLTFTSNKLLEEPKNNKDLLSFLNFYYKKEDKRDILIPEHTQDILDNIGHIIEESIELRQCFPRKYWKTQEKRLPKNEQLSELADIFIMWCIQAYVMGFKEEEVVQAILNKQDYNKKRKDHENVE